MTRSFPFAANLLDDAEMALAKADLAIAARYAELVEDSDARALFGLIEGEFRLTRELVLASARSLRAARR